MAVAVATGITFLLLMAGGYWALHLLLPKLGLQKMRELPSFSRRVLWISLCVGLVLVGFEVWAFSTRHAAVGVAVLAAYLVLPAFVLVPVHIRRARRTAKVSASAQNRLG